MAKTRWRAARPRVKANCQINDVAPEIPFRGPEYT